VLTAGSGVFYTVSSDGILRWWRHTGTATGAATWATGSGTQVGHGWQVFTTVVSLGGGVLYGVLPDGRLLWYRHLGFAAGTAGWAAGSGSVVGTGWTRFTRLVPGGLGSIYAMTPDGVLYWYAHDGWQTGRVAWAAGSGSQVGQGWQAFTSVFSGSGGILYGLLPDGTLRWYNHLGAVDGTGSWQAGVVTGVDLRGHTFLAGDPTVCTGLDRADATAVRRVSSGVLAGQGYSPTEFTCLSNIASKESSWRWNAGSLTGAYGIPQASPGTKMATVAADWVGNPVTQVRWMLAYVVSHYGSPCKAWTFWQAHGYY
jgi:hypothetical protein